MSDSVNVAFYCFQPLSLDHKTMLHSFMHPADLSFVFQQKQAGRVDWYEKFKTLNSVFDRIVLLEGFATPATEKLFAGMGEDAQLAGLLRTTLNQEASQSYLLLDTRFMYFMLVYEIHLKIGIHEVHDIVTADYGGKDFYNAIRRLLVKDDSQDRLSIWAEAARNNAIQCAADVMARAFDGLEDSIAIGVPNSSGNITCVIEAHELEDAIYQSLSADFLKVNGRAERLKQQDKEPIMLSNAGQLSFNGRFHTVLLREKSDFLRYIPIQFHVQYLWFLLRKINSILEDINANLTTSGGCHGLHSLNDLLDELINKIEVLVMHNENFKLAIESDNELVYSRVQGLWNLEGMLGHANRYATFFKGYLERAYDKQVSKIERKQNALLSVISVLQLITMISVWNDYLSITSDATISHASFLLKLFGDMGNLRSFNIFLPALLSGVVALLLIYAYRNGKAKR